MELRKFNPRAGQPLPVQVVSVDHSAGRGVATSVMPVAQLLQLVMDPRLAEDPARVASDPRLHATAELRMRNRAAEQVSRKCV